MRQRGPAQELKHFTNRENGGAEGARLLGEAVAACRAALEVFSAAHFPAYHEVVQANLARALQDLEQTS